jgi:hypothetical protein
MPTRRAVLSALIGAPLLGHDVALGTEAAESRARATQGAAVTNADKLAKATVRIVDGNGVGLGSGFHFIRPDIIVSNAHVAEPLIAGTGVLHAEAETGERWSLAVKAHSPAADFDYAVMQASGASFDQRLALKPDDTAITMRGKRLLYAGSLPSNYELNKFSWLQEDGSRFCSGASLSS